MTELWGAPLSEIWSVIVFSAATYVGVFILVRVAGRRTVSQMSAFDFVVTVAVGSLVATAVLDRNVGFARGMAAIATLLLAQQAVAVVRQRAPGSRRWLEFPPERLFQDGQLRLRRNPLTSQVNISEIQSELRRQGIGSVDDVRLVVLEPDGSMSVWAPGPEDRRPPADLWETQR